jgi:hypothetical protein
MRYLLISDKEITSMKTSVQPVPVREVTQSEVTTIETTLYDLIAAIGTEVGPHEEHIMTATVMHFLNAHRITCTGHLL